MVGGNSSRAGPLSVNEGTKSFNRFDDVGDRDPTSRLNVRGLFERLPFPFVIGARIGREPKAAVSFMSTSCSFSESSTTSIIFNFFFRGEREDGREVDAP